MSWGRIHWNCQPSPSMTVSSMSLNSSHILAPPSLTTSPWKLRSIRGLERQPQHLLASLHECGPTPNWQWRPRWSCAMPVLSAHWCTAVRRGPHMPDRRKDSNPSTWEASTVFWLGWISWSLGPGWSLKPGNIEAWPFTKGNRQLKFTTAGEQMPMVKEQPVKSLGPWYAGTLSDWSQSVAIMQQAEHGLKAIYQTKLPGKHKIWCLQFALYPRLAWLLTMYEVALSRVEMIEKTCNIYIRKWLGLPCTINTSSLYRRKGALQLPLTTIVEIYKAEKIRTVMMLRELRDQQISNRLPDVWTESGRRRLQLVRSSLHWSMVTSSVQHSPIDWRLQTF